jgi:long-chain fatty acid transport protein
MRKGTGFALCAAVAALLLPSLAKGGGFALYEHGSRAVGMGGAFAATADDPTAGYYNPAGLAFLKGTQVAGGAFFITETSKFRGTDPYPGTGYSESMKQQVFYPPHLYVTGKLYKDLRWEVGVFAPFGLGTWWPDAYAGKFITKRVDLKVFNVNPNLAWKVTDNLALAAGLDYFVSSVDLTKSIGVVNPYTQQVAEVGQVHLFSKSWETGTGWNAAALFKFGPGFSAGVSFRSRVKVKYSDADASFIQFPTGYADFDAIVASELPFDHNVAGRTEVNYPSELRGGLAWRNDTWTLEFDAVRIGWNSFQDLPITIVDRPDLSSVRPEKFHTSTTLRLGAEYRPSDQIAWQFGVLKDPTPMPTASVSPLLPDADRWGFSLGVAWMMSPNTRFGVSFLHLPFDERSTNGEDLDNFNGKYKTRAELLGFSLVYTF